MPAKLSPQGMPTRPPPLTPKQPPTREGQPAPSVGFVRRVSISPQPQSGTSPRSEIAPPTDAAFDRAQQRINGILAAKGPTSAFLNLSGTSATMRFASRTSVVDARDPRPTGSNLSDRAPPEASSSGPHVTPNHFYDSSLNPEPRQAEPLPQSVPHANERPGNGDAPPPKSASPSRLPPPKPPPGGKKAAQNPASLPTASNLSHPTLREASSSDRHVTPNHSLLQQSVPHANARKDKSGAIAQPSKLPPPRPLAGGKQAAQKPASLTTLLPPVPEAGHQAVDLQEYVPQGQGAQPGENPDLPGDLPANQEVSNALNDIPAMPDLELAPLPQIAANVSVQALAQPGSDMEICQLLVAAGKEVSDEVKHAPLYQQLKSHFERWKQEAEPGRAFLADLSAAQMTAAFSALQRLCSTFEQLQNYEVYRIPVTQTAARAAVIQNHKALIYAVGERFVNCVEDVAVGELGDLATALNACEDWRATVAQNEKVNPSFHEVVSPSFLSTLEPKQVAALFVSFDKLQPQLPLDTSTFHGKINARLNSCAVEISLETFWFLTKASSALPPGRRNALDAVFLKPTLTRQNLLEDLMAPLLNGCYTESSGEVKRGLVLVDRYRAALRQYCPADPLAYLSAHDFLVQVLDTGRFKHHTRDMVRVFRGERRDASGAPGKFFEAWHAGKAKSDPDTITVQTLGRAVLAIQTHARWEDPSGVGVMTMNGLFHDKAWTPETEDAIHALLEGMPKIGDKDRVRCTDLLKFLSTFQKVADMKRMWQWETQKPMAELEAIATKYELRDVFDQFVSFDVNALKSESSSSRPGAFCATTDSARLRAQQLLVNFANTRQLEKAAISPTKRTAKRT